MCCIMNCDFLDIFILNPIPHGIFYLQVPRRGSGFHPPYEKGLFLSNFFLTQLNLYIIVGLIQKETVRSSKLRELRNFEILVRNRGKNSGCKEKFITRSNLNISICKHLHFTSINRICNLKKSCYFVRPILKNQNIFKGA